MRRGLSGAQMGMLLELADANPAPEEKWENFDPDFTAKLARSLAYRGLIETKYDDGYRFHRLTPAGRAHAELLAKARGSAP